jgi:hypothetical protein
MHSDLPQRRRSAETSTGPGRGLPADEGPKHNGGGTSRLDPVAGGSGRPSVAGNSAGQLKCVEFLSLGAVNLSDRS